MGQVSSQNSNNLRLIDNATDYVIAKVPVSHTSKKISLLISLAELVEDFARTMPRVCGVISKNPTVKALKPKSKLKKKKFDFLFTIVLLKMLRIWMCRIAEETLQQ